MIRYDGPAVFLNELILFPGFAEGRHIREYLFLRFPNFEEKNRSGFETHRKY